MPVLLKLEIHHQSLIIFSGSDRLWFINLIIMALWGNMFQNGSTVSSACGLSIIS